MGNVASTSSHSCQSYTASDLLLDQMEQQVYAHQVAVSLSWTEIAARYCAIVLSAMTALLMGNFCTVVDQPRSTPVLVDAACQTEDEVFAELTVRRDWKSCQVNDKSEDEDDTDSCTTDTTEGFTDVENDDYNDQDFNSDDSEWDNVDTSDDELFYAICDACESCASSDCETQAEQLLRLTAIVCEESQSCPLRLEDYLCRCGECPQYDLITVEVAAAAKTSPCNEQYKQEITRLLQAFSTYNEVLGYRADMIPSACECLKTWCGDEDKAFLSFVTLYDELCDLRAATDD